MVQQLPQEWKQDRARNLNELEVIREWDKLQRLNKNMVKTQPFQACEYMRVTRKGR